MSGDTQMEETNKNTSPEATKSSKKRKSIGEIAPNPEAAGQPEAEITTPNKKKKKDKKKEKSSGEKADNKEKKKKHGDKPDTDLDADQHLNLDALSPIAHPLADKKLCKRVLKAVKKGSKERCIKRGVKEVVKALRKGEKGLVIMAGDISPMDVLTHIPLLAEENGSGYVFVPTKESLGSASCTKRPTSCVMITSSKGGSAAAQKKNAEKKEALIATDPTKASKMKAAEDEYIEAYKAALGEVLQLNEKISY